MSMDCLSKSFGILHLRLVSPPMDLLSHLSVSLLSNEYSFYIFGSNLICLFSCQTFSSFNQKIKPSFAISTLWIRIQNCLCSCGTSTQWESNTNVENQRAVYCNWYFYLMFNWFFDFYIFPPFLVAYSCRWRKY